MLYGRRRAGKIALINEFIKDKRAIYFMRIESNSKQNLDNFRNIDTKYRGKFIGGVEPELLLHDFQSVLDSVFKLSEKERLVLAIDEYLYIARYDTSLSSILQLLIDQYKDNSKLMLILCGSSMSYMENEVLAYKTLLPGYF